MTFQLEHESVLAGPITEGSPVLIKSPSPPTEESFGTFEDPKTTLTGPERDFPNTS